MGWLWRSLICGGRSGGFCDVCREEARVGSVVGRGTVRGGGGCCVHSENGRLSNLVDGGGV
jgi:hypothetical protein